MAMCFAHGDALSADVIEDWKRRIREYRARSQELRAKADASERKDLNVLHDAEMWDRMADWEERNPPGQN